MELRYHKPFGVAKTKFILIKKFKIKKKSFIPSQSPNSNPQEFTKERKYRTLSPRARGSGIAEALSQAYLSPSSFPWPAFPQALLMCHAPHYPLSWATGSPRTMALGFPTSRYTYNTNWATSSIYIAMEASLALLFLTRKRRPKHVE